MNGHSRRAIAQETVAILDRGSYTAPSGRAVDIAGRLAGAVAATRLYRPAELTGLPPVLAEAAGGTRVEVTGETTLTAARRLAGTGADEVCCLNFASAKNPGGGFLNGAHAQEEGLARSSGLYASLRTAGEFYDFHRAQGDLLYSDHMIYSPGVPVFRDDAAAARIPEVLRLRAARILALAYGNGHRRLVLGAWGCGVFRNDPAEVAAAFAGSLYGVFAGRFERVVFAVWDTAPGAPRHAAFQRVLRPG